MANSALNPETQLFVTLSQNVLIRDNMLGEPLYGGIYNAGQAFESVLNNRITLINNSFWQGPYNPTDDETVVFSGNSTDMSQQSQYDPNSGATGCPAGYDCAANSGTAGTFHFTYSDNYFYGGTPKFCNWSVS